MLCLQLFNFDVEVKPVLEVLVGKTMEQALLEVMEEEELANLRSQQREFEELRNAELVEQNRLEEQERRHMEEKVHPQIWHHCSVPPDTIATAISDASVLHITNCLFCRRGA